MSSTSMPLLDRVRTLAREQALFDTVRRVRVGFSGGADSTALLLVLRQLALALEAVHLHHGIRGSEADADALWCEQFCRELGIPFVCSRLDVPSRRLPGESLEQTGRRLRLEYWRQTTPAVDAVALAHHLDDCLEDVLLRLTRGANAGGFTAMRPAGELGGVRVLRPFLHVRRAEIEVFLKAQGRDDWRRDHTNSDTSLRRNAVRHQWLPLIRATVGHDAGLIRSLEALRDDADCLAELARNHLPALACPDELRRLHPALLPRLLRLWLREETGADWIVSHETVQRLLRELTTFSGNARRLPLGRDRVLQLDAGGLHLVADLADVPSCRWGWRHQPRLELPEVNAVIVADCLADGMAALAQREAATEIFDAEALGEELGVRAWRPGDRLVPFGRTSPVKLQDLFTDARVPRQRRRCIPVLLSGEIVVWVPGLRRAEFGRCQAGRPAVCLRWNPDAAAGAALD